MRQDWVQQCLLDMLAATHPLVFDDAVVSMILAVLVSVGDSQKHDAYRIGDSWHLFKGVGLHHKPFSGATPWNNG